MQKQQKQSNLLWVTDPWNTLAHHNDTTLRLMQEAVKMGIPTYWSGSDFILNSSSPTCLSVIRCDPPFSFDLHQNKPVEMEASIFHQLHYRVDPPVDFNYIAMVDQLLNRGVTESSFLNPPNLLKHQSEKLPPEELRSLCPRLAAIFHKTDLKAAYTLFQNDPQVVTKPLNTAQSQGVKKWKMPASESEWTQLFELETQNFSVPLMVEEFLPGVDDGEVRVWYAQGEIIAALKKFPKKGDFRVLIDEGSQIKAYQLNPEERIAAEKVGAVLKKQRAAMAAIDFISGKISDYNITSPGLLVQLEQVHGGQNFAKIILETLLK